MNAAPFLRATLTVVIAMSACGSDSTGPSDITGEYVLTAVSGGSVPFTRVERDNDPSCLQAGVRGRLTEQIAFGELTVEESRAFEMRIITRRICTFAGSFSQTSSTVRLHGVVEARSGRFLLHTTDPRWPTLEATAGRSRVAVLLQAPEDLRREYVFEPWPFRR